MSPVSDVRVGVLALQGAVREHARAFGRLGLPVTEVRRPSDLAGLSHLVLPGGESTTMTRLLGLFGLRDPIATAYREGRLALFGLCAGAILLAREVTPTPDAPAEPGALGLLDARIARNAYGRQVDSFQAPLALTGRRAPLPGVFIRAPRFLALGPGVEIEATLAGGPVAVRAPGLLAAAFHPELTDDLELFRRFLALAPRSGAGAGRADPAGSGVG